MSRNLLATSDSIGPLLLRLSLGIVMFAHGAQKVLGWFGGPGLEGTFAMFEQSFGIPPALAALAIAAEFLGGLLLIVGAFGRLAALAIGVDMIVAALVAHVSNGFFMNWSGQQAGEGFEYHVLAVGMAAALVVLGSGCCSVDRALSRRKERRVVVVTPAPETREPAGTAR